MQGDALAPYMFIVVIDYIMSLVTLTDNTNHRLTISPARSRRYPVEKVTDADFADDLALLSNTIDES